LNIEEYHRQIAREEAERVAREVVAELAPTARTTPWMNDRELAVYLRLFDRDGNPQTASIRKWTSRPDNPLPFGMAGGHTRRYHREQVDRWMLEEAERVKGGQVEEEEEVQPGLRRVK
jgi:hypothetical protein